MIQTFTHAFLSVRVAIGLMLFCGLCGTAKSQVSLTATGGAPTGTFTTLNAAFTAINAGTHTGAITITITANTTEPAPPVPLNSSGTGAASYASILIRPSGNVTVNSAAIPTTGRGVIEFLGADNVTIDGDDPATAGTNNLTFQCATSTSTGIAVIRFASVTATTDGATNNIVRYCNITGSRDAASSTVTNYGIYSGTPGTATTSTTGQSGNNDNLTLQNNVIIRCYYGIYCAGTTTNYTDNLVIRNNTIGSATVANFVGLKGIYIQNTQAIATPGASVAQIEGNDIRVTSAPSFAGAIHGIDVAAGNAGAIISKNKIHDMYQSNTAGYGAYGLVVSSATNNSQINIVNNFIWDIRHDTWGSTTTTTDLPVGIMILSNAANIKIYHNSVSINLANTDNTSACVSSAIQFNGTITTPDVRNNIFSNTQPGNAGDKHFAIRTTAAVTFGNINNNDYYVNTTGTPVGVLGNYAGTDRTTLAQWQSSTGQDALSLNVNPNFTTTTDLHITTTSTAVNDLGAALSIATDIDGDARSLTTPDIGADEYTPPTCAGAVGGTVTPATASVCEGTTYTMSTTGSTSGLGVTYQWEVSTTGGGVGFSNVTGGSGAGTTIYTTGTLTAGTYYYRLRVDCSTGPSTDYSNELVLTVNPLPVVSVTPPSASICMPGGSVGLTASGAATYTWSPATGLSATTGASVTANPSVTTTYTVTGTTAGCIGASTVVVTVNSAATINSITATPPSVCLGGNTTLNVNASLAAGSYCTPTYSTGTGFGDYISSVSVNTLTNTSAGAPTPYYTLFPATTTLAAGSTYTITLSPGTYTSNDLAAWIDYDQDGIFNNTTEKLGQTLNMAAMPATTTYTFTVPATAYSGITRLRIREADQGSATMDPCTGYTYGETEDYNITISGGASMFTYAWSESPSSGTLTSTTTNPTTATGLTVDETYTVVISSLAGCTDTGSVTVTVGAPLVCGSITTSPVICSGQNFTLSIAPTGGGAPYSFSWSDGAGGVYANNDTITGNLAAGTYTFTVTVTDGCAGTCTSNITVVVDPTPVVTVTPPSASICNPGGSPVTMNASGATSYTWSPATGLSGTTGTTVTANPSSTTTYAVTGTTGACSSTTNVTISVGSVVTLSSVTATPSTVCVGGGTTLTATATLPTSAYCTPTYSTGTGFGDYISNVNVNTLNNTTAGAPTPYYTLYTTPTTTLTAGTTYTITLTPGTYTSNDLAAWIDYNQDGVFNNTTEKLGQTLNMAAMPATTTYTFTVPVTALNGTTRLRIREADQGSTTMDPCTGYTYGETEDYNITITGGLAMFTYAWSESPSSGTLTSTTTNPTTATGLTVDETYTVTVTSYAGCTATGSVNVTVGAPLTCTGISTSLACSGSNFTLIANTTGGGSPYNYTWSDGVGGVYANNDTITANLAAGTYTFTVTVTDACGGSCTSTQTVTVNASPTVSVSPTTGNICNPGGTPVTLTATGAVTYAWSPASGLSATTGATVTANPAIYTTTYTVTGTDAIGCTGTATATINVSTYPVVTATATPTVVCPGGSTALSGTISYATAPYCTPTYTTGTGFGDYISVVNVNTLSNTTGGAPTPYYTFYTTPTTTLTAGTTYTITLTPGTYTSNDLAAWIDYNQDGVFDNVNEKLGQTLNMAAMPATTSYSFTVPAGAYNGITRLRIREADQGSTTMDPCTGYTYGETEDYEITITGGVAPYTFAWSESPANGTLTSTTTNPTTATGITVNETYILTATSNAGCVSADSVVVNIDNIIPTITCPANVTVNADAGLCSASGVALGTPTTADNCSVASTTNDAPATFPVGTTTVTWTVTDGSGNTATCTQIITIVDAENPTITCPANVTVNADAGLCSASGVSLGTPITADNCAVASTTNDAPATFPVGTTTVTWTVTDVNGNTATCTQTVTVVDGENPTITCPANVTVNADAGLCSASGVPLGTPTTADNCAVASTTNDAPATFPVGTTTVTWTVIDINGNSATCTQTVTVMDAEVPVITCPANVTVNADMLACAATGVSLGIPTVTDNCGIATVTNDGPPSYPVGTTTVTWTATDINGNVSTCAQTVTVIDTQNPTITCPANVTVNADAGLCSASGVSLGTPATNDNCAVASTTNDAPATFPVGTTTVTWTVTDVNGNSATCMQTVTVVDAENPTITCPANVTVNADAGLCSASGVSLGTPTTADNCSVASTTNDAPAIYALGTTTVTWTVTDVNGNVSTCAQTVTVIDNQAPVVSGCPADITIDANSAGCSAVVTWTPPTATDNCLGAVIPTSTHNSGDAFTAGTTAVTYTFDDGNGNTSTCTFNVTVVNTLVASASATDALCNGAASGSIDLTVSGGTPSYTYDWDNDGTGDGDDAEDVAVGAGTHSVIVTDAIGCTTTVSATVNEPAAITFMITTTDPSCNGSTDGFIDLSVTGGTGAYVFDWDNDGTGDTDDTEDLTGLADGVYTVTVTDANGCSASTSATMNEPAAINLTGFVTNDGCSAAATGSINVLVEGGTPTYTYNWSNGTTTEDISGLAAGTYTLTVTDSKGCTGTETYTVTTGTPSSMTFTFTLCAGQSFTVGSNTYTTTGTYVDTLTGPSGCDSIITTNLTVNPPVDVSTTTAGTTITANSASATSYQWLDCNAGMAPIPGETGPSYTAQANGDYAVVVFEAGCPDTSACVDINGVGIEGVSKPAFELYPNPNNGAFIVEMQIEGLVTIANSLGQLIYTTNLVTGKNQLNIGNVARGTYTVRILNADGKTLIGTRRMVIMQ